MNLVISGKHSIEQMESWVVEKFGPIENKDVEVPEYDKSVLPFTEDNCGKIIKYNPIKDKDVIEIYFILPYLE